MHTTPTTHWTVRRKRTGTLAAALVAALVFATLVPLVAPAPAHAQGTIHVATTGSDATGDGSETRPYRTITAGLAAAGAGDVVQLAAGEYGAGETLPLQPGPRVSVHGQEDPFAVRIVGDGVDSVFELDGASRDCVLEGLYITGGGGTAGLGGGIRILGGTAPGYGPTIRRCYVQGNEAGRGGGIGVLGGGDPCRPALELVLVLGNQATFDWGGGIYAFDAELELDLCVVSGNVAEQSGGGLFVWNSQDLSLEGCFIQGNTAANFSGGGMMIGDSTPARLERCEIGLNQAQTTGAGVHVWDEADVRIDSSMVYQNTSASGADGGIFATDATFRGRNVTVADNTGGVSHAGTGSGRLTNSILWGNGDDVDGVTSTYSDIQDGDPGTGNITADPRFLLTWPWDYRIARNSPCLDTGSNADVPALDIVRSERPLDGDLDGNAVNDMGAFERPLTVDRLAGADRYATANAIAADEFFLAGAAVIATGRDYPDALCASALAGFYGGPILLTQPDYLPEGVLDRLAEHDLSRVFIVGGEGVVHDSVRAELEAAGYAVERLAGSDRYATSRAVAEHIIGEGEPAFPVTEAFVARGDLFPDALALSPYAYGQAWPVLLTRPDSLPASTEGAITSLGLDTFYIAGGTGAVSSQVENRLDVLGESVERFGGSDRYGTALALALKAQDADWADFGFVGLATGLDFPDALAGGGRCGYEHGVLMLTRPDALPEGVAAAISARRTDVMQVYAFGGEAVVYPDVLEQVRNILR
jgi:putative cell wall-binding protein